MIDVMLPPVASNPNLNSRLPLLLAFGTIAAIGFAAAFIDRPVAMWARTLPPSWRPVAAIITEFGSSSYMFAGAALALSASLVFAKARGVASLQRRAERAGLGAILLIATLAVSGLGAQAIKHLVGRVRPRFSVDLDAAAFHGFGLHNSAASFPSGHATSAFAAASILGLMYPRARWTLVLAAVSVSLSRIVLGEHYPSDVVAGAGLGLLVSLALSQSERVGRAREWVWSRTLSIVTVDQNRASGYQVIINGRWSLPLLVVTCFSLGSPPADLFGSTAAEQLKDGFAILIALCGLGLRGLALCKSSTSRNLPPVPSSWHAPLRLGSVMVVLGIVVMHGALLTLVLGSAAALAIFAIPATELMPSFAVGRERVKFKLRRIVVSDYPVIGTTVIALAFAEFWEELTEPQLTSRLIQLEGLVGVMLAGALGIIVCKMMHRRFTHQGLEV